MEVTMLGIIYIFLSFTVGWVICSYAFPGLTKLIETDYNKRKISLSPYILLFPAWYITGTLAITWAVYLIAYLFGNTAEPLFYADLIVMPAACLLSAFVFYRKVIRSKNNKFNIICNDKKAVRAELILLTAVTLLSSILMWATFFVKGDELYIGVTVFSDFSPHIGMIRSFSFGNNFPTTYSHYAGVDIRYHFMFQFLTGNLEYLGMRLDYAFNIPSILSLVSAFLLLYFMAVKITGKIGAGLLACLFFAFRSSKTLFTYIANLPKGTNVFKALADNIDFISDTPHEDWGLWNLNVYCNQRHLAFGLAAIFLVIILFLPHLYAMFEALKNQRLLRMEHRKKNAGEHFGTRIRSRIEVIFFTKEGWLPENIKRAVAAGILLGSLSFFHGSAVFGCITVLFIMAVMSERRLEYLITAVIAVFLSLLQTHLFIEGSAVSAKFLFGFIAENKTLFGVASYLERLLGILPFVLLAAFCLEKGVGRYLILAFTAPLVFAFTVSLTNDVTVNHKYIMMSCILLGIFAASLLMKLFERRDYLLRLVGILLAVMLTATGIYDFFTVLKKNSPAMAIVLNMEDPLTDWIDEHSDSKDIYLTSNYTINQVVLGGAMLYEGWPYFPWSAGYDTEFRTEQVKQMYQAETPQELDALIKKNNIRFIIIDYNNRIAEDYVLNEDNIRTAYECVYQDGVGDWMVSVYDTHKPLFNQ
jgi:hypothetical protein